MRGRVKGIYARILALRDTFLNPPEGAYPAPRPDELIMCTLCLLSGIPTLLGQPPASIDAVLWSPLRYVWATAIVILPMVIIWTSLARWRGLTGQKLVDSGEAFRQASKMLALASFAYAVALMSFSGLTSAVAFGLLIGFGLGRFWRAYEMGRWLGYVRSRE